MNCGVAAFVLALLEWLSYRAAMAGKGERRNMRACFTIDSPAADAIAGTYAAGRD